MINKCYILHYCVWALIPWKFVSNLSVNGSVCFGGFLVLFFVSISPHREGLPACCPDEHELCHLGPFDDEHPTSLQLPGAHEPSISRPYHWPQIQIHLSVTVRLPGVCRHNDPEPSSRHIYERFVGCLLLCLAFHSDYCGYFSTHSERV